MVAMIVLLLLHTPPVETVVSAAEVPIHIVEGPVMADGGVFTVTVAVVKQPGSVPIV
jgi:hypothetical protein